MIRVIPICESKICKKMKSGFRNHLILIPEYGYKSEIINNPPKCKRLYFLFTSTVLYILEKKYIYKKYNN